jgi:hypothetical protein
MAIKSYAEMRKIDVSPFVEKRDGMDYLNWAKCVDLLYDNGAEKVFFEPLVNDNGSSLFMSEQTFTDKNGNTNRCYEVAVKITIDDDVFVMRSPLMNGSNPVKDNSLSQQRVWNAQTRCFVKGVALRTGLGFGLWSANDYTEEKVFDDSSKHSLKVIKERVQTIYTEKHRIKKMSTGDIAKALNKTEEEVKLYFTYYDMLDKFEKDLMQL